MSELYIISNLQPYSSNLIDRFLDVFIEIFDVWCGEFAYHVLSFEIESYSVSKDRLS